MVLTLTQCVLVALPYVAFQYYGCVSQLGTNQPAVSPGLYVLLLIVPATSPTAPSRQLLSPHCTHSPLLTHTHTHTRVPVTALTVTTLPHRFLNAEVARPGRPWCGGVVPSLYGFVQREYWNQGFLHYWEPKQVCTRERFGLLCMRGG